MPPILTACEARVLLFAREISAQICDTAEYLGLTVIDFSEGR
jgi:hypothetical protein